MQVIMSSHSLIRNSYVPHTDSKSTLLANAYQNKLATPGGILPGIIASMNSQTTAITQISSQCDGFVSPWRACLVLVEVSDVFGRDSLTFMASILAFN